MKKLITLLISSYTLAASPSIISHFSNSLETDFGLKSSRLDDVITKVRIRRPNVLEKWMMNRSGAEATYNDKTNTIVLRDKNWIGGRIISSMDFDKDQRFRFSIMASTIFHELMHADFDVLIKKTNSKADLALKDAQKWFSTNARAFNAHIAAHEFFGYTASDIIFGLQSQIQDILMAHGINALKESCFPPSALKRIRERLFKDGKVYFKDVLKIEDYSSRFTPNTVFVKGKSIDLVELKMPQSIRSSIYDIFVQNYQAPRASKDLVAFVQTSYDDLLRECYSLLEKEELTKK